MKCRVCDSNPSAFMSFGRMPVANGFLEREKFGSEYFYELKPVFCENCGTFQIEDHPSPDMMFHSDYAFFSRTSEHMRQHFKSYADWVCDKYLGAGDEFVVEIGSNDGILLENFASRGIRHLGCEPSSNVAAVARNQGVDSVVDFFSSALAGRLVSEYQHASAILAANVICHIPDIHDIAVGVDLLLKPDGVFIFEEPYLGSMIEKTSYDQIYDEHVYIFSAISVASIFEQHGFELVELLPQETHGGSMRYVLARVGMRPVHQSVFDILQHERNSGLHLPGTYDAFRSQCEKSKSVLNSRLGDLQAEGRRVVGYGATSKSTTILNYCDIGPDLIEAIVDTTPIKQGKFSPGMHIPIEPPSFFSDNYPDVAVLFAWNHREEIMKKESRFSNTGGSWITHLDFDK